MPSITDTWREPKKRRDRWIYSRESGDGGTDLGHRHPADDHHITAHTSRVRAVTWSPDGAHLPTFSLAWLDDLIAIGQVGPPTLVKLTDDRHAEMSEPTL